MGEENCISAAIEPLLVLTVQTKLVRTLAGTPLGERRIVDVISGIFQGPRLSGCVPASGGDWLISTPRGARLDVRLLLETDDGVSILFRYSGKSSGSASGQPRIEVAGSFDAPEGAYDWLNDIQAFGLGVPIPEGVRYHFYRFK